MRSLKCLSIEYKNEEKNSTSTLFILPNRMFTHFVRFAVYQHDLSVRQLSSTLRCVHGWCLSLAEDWEMRTILRGGNNPLHFFRSTLD